jgi:hypothetical protein
VKGYGHSTKKIKPEYVPVIKLALQWAKEVPISRDFDIPYIAGYSQDAKQMYIDRRAPIIMHWKGQIWHLERFLSVHEMVEKFLEAKFDMPYDQGGTSHAHDIATEIELANVKAHGLDPEAYQSIWDKLAPKLEKAPLYKCPKDLDLTPYENEKDYELIKRIKAAQRWT